jgi:drug/metabolite transporter (DMT)-like permease
MDVRSPLRSQNRVPIEFVTLSALWGISFVAIQVGLRQVPPLLFAALRYDVAGLGMLALAVGTTAHWRPQTGREWLATTVAGVFIIGIHHALLYLGQQHVSGAVAAVVVSLVPVLTAVFAAVPFPDERLDGIQYGGVVFGFAGVAAIVAPTSGPFVVGSTIGVGLVFLSGVSFALGSVALRPLSTELPLRSLQAWAMLIGAGFLHGASVARGEPFVVPTTATGLGAFAYLSLLSGVVGYLMYFDLLDRIGPSELNLGRYLQPVFTTIVSWAFLGELIDSTTVAGLLTIFVGFALVKHAALIEVAETVDRAIGIGDA